MAPKVNKYLGYFWCENMSKLAQSGHTAYEDLGSVFCCLISATDTERIKLMDVYKLQSSCLQR